MSKLHTESLQCGFGVAQATAAKEERQQQKNQIRVAILATLFLNLPTLQMPLSNTFSTLECLFQQLAFINDTDDFRWCCNVCSI